jgi:hypothetical protein
VYKIYCGLIFIPHTCKFLVVGDRFPPHSPASSKRKRVDDEELRDWKRQKLGLGELSSVSGKENIPPASNIFYLASNFWLSEVTYTS